MGILIEILIVDFLKFSSTTVEIFVTSYQLAFSS